MIYSNDSTVPQNIKDLLVEITDMKIGDKKTITGYGTITAYRHFFRKAYKLTELQTDRFPASGNLSVDIIREDLISLHLAGVL